MTEISYLAALRGVHARDFEREGIAMVLTLQSTVGTVPDAVQPGVQADGAQVAQAVQAARAEMFPTQRDNDLGCLITTLQAASSVAFDGPAR